MSRWFRMYSDVLDDPKVQKLPPALFKTWVNILCLAGRNDGRLPSVEDIAFSLRMEEDQCGQHIRELVERGLLDAGDGLTPHNWDKRQFKSDHDETAAERQRNKRLRDKREDVTRDKSVTSHPPEQIQIQIQTQSRTESPRVASGALETKLREAAGWQGEPHPGLFVTGPIEALIANGADLELDVLPVVRGRAATAKPVGWRYFVGPIQDAVRDRTSAATGPPSSAAKSQPPQKSFEELAKELLPGWNPGPKLANSIG